VTTYGIIAAGAGNGSGARQVARILHSSSKTHGLPWHRVVNRAGKISLPPGRGYELQRDLLLAEGVTFMAGNVIDFQHFLWLPGTNSQ
jgi:methylated-DNA-protein-cysteine methyltransferase-like protein